MDESVPRPLGDDPIEEPERDHRPTPETEAPRRFGDHLTFLRRVALKYRPSAGDPAVTLSDHVQESFVQVIKADKKGKGPAHSKNAEGKFLARVLQNQVWQEFRRQSAKKRAGQMEARPIDSVDVPSQSSSPSAKFQRKSREECFAVAWASLSPSDQELLRELSMDGGKSRKDIARGRGVSPTYISRIHKQAREKLKQAYLQEGGTWDFT